MILKDGLKLYHGSYVIVEKPDLAKCRGQKDFGKGFYLTTDRQQAERFVRSSVRKAIHEGKILQGADRGYVSCYQYVADGILCEIHEFSRADSEWLECIVSHRRPDLLSESNRWEQFDILAGKIANDNTNPTIIAYMSGLYGPVGSSEALDQAIRLLMPYRLKNQICFRTNKALSHLRYLGNEMVVWKH